MKMKNKEDILILEALQAFYVYIDVLTNFLMSYANSFELSIEGNALYTEALESYYKHREKYNQILENECGSPLLLDSIIDIDTLHNYCIAPTCDDSLLFRNNQVLSNILVEIRKHGGKMCSDVEYPKYIKKLNLTEANLHIINRNKETVSLKELLDSPQDNQSNQAVTFDTVTGELKYKGNIHKFHRGKKGQQTRLQLMIILWESRKEYKNGMVIRNGKARSLPYLIKDLNTTLTTPQIKEMMRNINRNLKTKRFPVILNYTDISAVQLDITG